MNAPALLCTARMNVDCDSNVVAICLPGPMQGLPSSSQAPNMESATSNRAGRNIHRPDAGIRTEAAQKLKRSDHFVRHRHPIQRTRVVLSFRFEMKPHHELPGLAIKDDLGPFEDAAARDRTPRIIAHRQR